MVHSVDAELLVVTLQKPLREAMTSPLIRWRLDRDEVASVYVQLRGNLLGEDVPPLKHGQADRKDSGCNIRVPGGCICCSWLVLCRLNEVTPACHPVTWVLSGRLSSKGRTGAAAAKSCTSRRCVDLLTQGSCGTLIAVSAM